MAWQPRQPPEVTGDGSLTRAARLLREFHDLTAGTALAGDREVVCHNDVSPRNTVYRDLGAGLRPVAFLDWDLAAPGDRVQDLAHLCWQYLDLGPVVGDAVRAGRRMRAVCDAYGLPDRRTLLDTVLWWQDRCARGIAAQAAAGDPAMVRLRERGVVAGVRAARDWVERHRGELATGLDDGDATPGRR